MDRRGCRWRIFRMGRRCGGRLESHRGRVWWDRGSGLLCIRLAARGGAWAHELTAGRAFRAAVNQSIASGDTPIKDGDEVAFFPPVTGG